MDKELCILVIEDEEAIRTILKDELQLHGFEVFLAREGRPGLKLARKLAKKQKPDVILLDWMMPNMNGLEVLSKLKHNEKTVNIPVFMLTAKSTLADIERAYELGADDHICKPFQVLKIAMVIRQKLNKLQAIVKS